MAAVAKAGRCIILAPMLISLAQTAGFLLAAILVILSPGPDNLMVLSLGLARGRRAGMVFGLGCALGCLSHTTLAALGVSALIAASPVAFTGLKLAGGAYLLWLGWQALRSHGSGPLPCQAGNGSLRRLFAKGLVANAINPKVILFFLAFLPQFVDVGRGGVAWQTAQLGVLFTFLSVLIFGAIGYFSGVVGAWLARAPGRSAWLDRGAGCVFVLLGLRLLTAR